MQPVETSCNLASQDRAETSFLGRQTQCCHESCSDGMPTWHLGPNTKGRRAAGGQTSLAEAKARQHDISVLHR